MKLKGWYIDGFGMFRDHEVTNLSGGLTVFAGPNEAGKSTLLAFLRGMLFGFPDGRSRPLRYPRRCVAGATAVGFSSTGPTATTR